MPDTTLITVETTVSATVGKVWEFWTSPEHIMKWNNASEDWHTPSASSDLREGGTFMARMEAKDGSAGFDFGGTFTKVVPEKLLGYEMSDGRKVSVSFTEKDGVTHISETFDAEHENPEEMQRQGWQSILDNFKKHAEANAGL